MKPLKYIDPLRIFTADEPLIDIRDPDHRVGLWCAVLLILLAAMGWMGVLG